MPTISRFLGIVITMYYKDHNPPHFHAKYNEFEAEYGIDPMQLLVGSLPNRAHGHVLEWARLHVEELKENWKRVMGHKELVEIKPLE